MAGFLSGKMKRKDLDEVSDEFSEFSLSSPARKIRRLDADLPPIMEEEEVAVPFGFQQQLPREQMASVRPQMEALVEDVPVIPVNEERAIVLYKPVDSPIFLTPGSSNVSLTVSWDLYPGLKNHAYWNQNSSTLNKPSIGNKHEIDDSLAVVPWVPTQTSSTLAMGVLDSRNGLQEEPMEAEEPGAVSMEVEEDMAQITNTGVGSEVFQQCHQHCMTPEISTTASTPIMWSW